MHGQAEAVVGKFLKDLNARKKLWLTSKVWTRSARSGIDEMEQSYRLMNAGSFMELMQIRNLVDWKSHYKTLRQWKEDGKIRYIGISHYSSSSFNEMIQILHSYPDIDFVQYIHSMRNHVAENKLLPFCRDHGVATMANRPVEQGALLRRRENRDLPPWTADYSIESWSQFFLKFLISHPNVTCIIPATSNPAHMADNLNAGRGKLLDEKIRLEMIAWVGR
jgi:diketogulonate reductase-like aldo/keto reductase